MDVGRACDGFGYDIRSFDEDGEPIFIEVKTTRRGHSAPFLVTRNEVEKSKELGQAYRLYRVFDFGRKSLIYVLHGSLFDVCSLEPQVYSARPANGTVKFRR